MFSETFNLCRKRVLLYDFFLFLNKEVRLADTLKKRRILLSVKIIKSTAAIDDFCDHLKSRNIPFYYFKVDQFYMFYENSDF